MGKKSRKSRRKKPAPRGGGAVHSNQPAAASVVARYCDKECQVDDFSHHAQCCPLLARRWDGVGPIPTQLFTMRGSSDDPASSPAREQEKD